MAYNREALAARLQELADRYGSAASLSGAAGLNPRHLSMLIRRLKTNEDADVELSTLFSLADTAGVSRAWLLGLEVPPGFVAGALPGWEAAERVARARHVTVPNEAWEAAQKVVLPYAVLPDPIFVLSLARALYEAHEPAISLN